MKRVLFVLVVGLVALAATVGLMAFRPNVQAAALDKGQVRIDLIVRLGADPTGTPSSVERVVQAVSGSGSFAVDSFFDITYAANIGSSGEDGFSVDSFFDIEYRFESSADRSVDIELVALSLSGTMTDPSNPGGAMDDLRKAVSGAGGDTYYGHVTVLK